MLHAIEPLFFDSSNDSTIANNRRRRVTVISIYSEDMKRHSSWCFEFSVPEICLPCQILHSLQPHPNLIEGRVSLQLKTTRESIQPACVQTHSEFRPNHQRFRPAQPSSTTSLPEVPTLSSI